MRPVIVLSLVAVLGARVAHAEPPDLVATYDKGIVLATDDGRVRARLALRNQFRVEVTRPTDDGAETSSRLYIPRARIQLEGNVFGADTRYKLELAIGDRGSFSFVRDLFVDQRVGATPVWLRFGQWKRPFNRQELVADFASELNERAITADFAGGGRDVGVAIHNDYETSPDGLEWAFGVFNGFSGGADRPVIATTCVDDMVVIDCTTPPPTTVPTDFSPALVARAGWNLGGIKGYSEADLEGGPLRLAVGVSYKIDLADAAGGAQSHGLEADALLKVHGFDLQVGAYLMKLAGADAEVAGFVQAGQFLVPRRAQVAARVAAVPIAGDRMLVEARGAFNWFREGHRWKWATDLGVLHAGSSDLQLRSMAQLTF